MTKLSIICLAYNHAKFIRQALEGFVCQKTNFPFEVIVHDDASFDGTAEIIREFESKYPDIIKPIYQTENQWSKGVDVIKEILCPQIRGEYVAFNEGDDYWTDEYKLQKQVDFLDSHPDYSICFHSVFVHWEDNREADSVFPEKRMLRDMSLQGLLKSNFIQTNSVVYRWLFHTDPVSLIPTGIMPEDWYLHLLHAQIGKIGYIDEEMSVYRRHEGGIWTGVMTNPDWFNRCLLPYLKFFQCVEEQFAVDQTNRLVEIAREGLRVFLLTKNFDKIKLLAETYPSVYQQAVQVNAREMAGRNRTFKFAGITLLKVHANPKKTKYLLFGFIPILKVRG